MWFLSYLLANIFSSINSKYNLVDLFALLYVFMIEMLVCFMYNALLYHFVFFFFVS